MYGCEGGESTIFSGAQGLYWQEVSIRVFIVPVMLRWLPEMRK